MTNWIIICIYGAGFVLFRVKKPLPEPSDRIIVGNNPLNWIDPWGLCGGGGQGEKTSDFIKLLLSLLDILSPSEIPPPIQTVETTAAIVDSLPIIGEYNQNMFEEWQEISDFYNEPNPYQDTYRTKKDKDGIYIKH